MFQCKRCMKLKSKSCFTITTSKVKKCDECCEAISENRELAEVEKYRKYDCTRKTNILRGFSDSPESKHALDVRRRIEDKQEELSFKDEYEL